MSALYAVNTLGAVTGALLTGFVLIGSVGISRTFLIAALCNTLVGLGAIALDRFGRTVPAEPTAPPSAVAPRSSGPAIVWWVMGASGFASLALEIVWFRLMAQALDGTTYAVTVTLASVLMGIALGGAVSARLLAREGDWLAWLTVAQAATACAILFGVGLLRWDHPLGLPPQRGAVRVVALVLLPSLLMGISFPMLLRLGVPSARDAGKRGTLVGRFYSINVLGAIGGSLASGFLIVPALGTWSATVLLAGSFLAAAMMLALAHPRRGRALAGVAAGAIAFAWLA